MPTRRVELFSLGFLTCFFLAFYVIYGLYRHWHFYTSAYDLGIFDQAIWHLSRLELPASSINGSANLFGDHFHPIIALFAPLYWIAPAPETLIVAQAVLLAAAIAPIYFYLRGRLPHGPSLALCAAYGFFWGVQHTAAYDVHEVAFTPLLIACAIFAMDRQRWRMFWLAMAALVLNKEDLIPLVMFFGIFLLSIGKRGPGIALVAGSAAVFLLVVGWLIPWLKGGEYLYAGIYGDLMRRPWTAPLVLITPASKLMAVLNWLAPFAFLPLFSPLALLLVPLALTRLLATNPTYWGIAFHYGAPLAAVLVMAAGDGLARLAVRLPSARARTRLIAWTAGATVVLSAILPGNQPFWDIFSREHFATTNEQRAWPEIASLIPADARVVAQAALVPHLSHRRTIHLLDERAPDADFVLANAALNPWPAARFDELRALLEDRRRRGYRVVLDRDGWLVLARD